MCHYNQNSTNKVITIVYSFSNSTYPSVVIEKYHFFFLICNTRFYLSFCGLVKFIKMYTIVIFTFMKNTRLIFCHVITIIFTDFRNFYYFFFVLFGLYCQRFLKNCLNPRLGTSTFSSWDMKLELMSRLWWTRMKDVSIITVKSFSFASKTQLVQFRGLSHVLTEMFIQRSNIII